jgi:hypothetical protein
VPCSGSIYMWYWRKPADFPPQDKNRRSYYDSLHQLINSSYGRGACENKALHRSDHGRAGLSIHKAYIAIKSNKHPHLWWIESNRTGKIIVRFDRSSICVFMHILPVLNLLLGLSGLLHSGCPVYCYSACGPKFPRILYIGIYMIALRPPVRCIIKYINQ